LFLQFSIAPQPELLAISCAYIDKRRLDIERRLHG
jgi:hypothetical protein